MLRLTDLLRPFSILILATAAVLGANASHGLILPATILGVILGSSFQEAGHGVLRLLRIRTDSSAEYLAGLALAAHLLSVPVMLLGWSLTLSAGIFLALSILAAVWRQLRPLPIAPPCSTAALSLVGVGGFALIWSVETTCRYAGFASTGVFPLALDAMMHAGLIAEFGDPLIVGRGNASMVDVPHDLYHFASYAFPGLGAWFFGQAPLEAFVSIWVPLGILATGIGVYVLGAALGGSAAGAIAVTLLAGAPDPASYGLGQGFYSFHWLMEVAPGSLYALPVGALSCALLCRWCRAADVSALVASFVFLAAMFLLRIHLMVWLAVPWGVAALLGTPWLTVRVKAMLLTLGLVGIPLLMAVYSRSEINQLGLLGFMTSVLTAVHRNMTPNNYQSLFAWLSEHLSGFAMVPVLVALSLAAIGGLPLPIFLALIWVHRRRLESIDAIPLALLVWAIVLMLLAPFPAPSYGDPSEFRHRGMVLIHPLLCCWNARLILFFFPAKAWRPRILAWLPVLVLPLTILFVATWKAPHAAWAIAFRQTRISPDLLVVSRWMRERAHRGDSFAMTNLTSRAPNVDEPTEMMALTGVPAFISRPGVQGGAAGNRAATVQTRLDLLNEVATAPEPATAMQLLRGGGVTFLVVRGDGPAWDPARKSASLVSGTLAVWQIARDS